MGALNVSDYTSSIDGREFKDENKRKMAMTKEIGSFFNGMLLAHDYEMGQKGTIPCFSLKINIYI
jgi:hypothetical protein